SKIIVIAIKGGLRNLFIMSQIEYSGLDITQEALKVINVAANVTPFGSLISGITDLISDIIKFYNTAQCNKKICSALLDRAQSAELALKSLNKKKQENEENFRKKEYYHAFLRFEMVLQQIKDFAIDVTQLQGFEKIFKANLVSEKFTQLTNDFDRVIKDLNFTMAISSDEQRINDQKNLKDNLDEMKKLLIMKKQMSNKANDNTSIINEIRTWQIVSNELKDPFPGQKDDIRGVIVKKVLGEYEDVACKPVTLPKEDSRNSKRILSQLVILEKLSNRPNILKFYGLSYIDNKNIIVFEWAELGNLKEVYKKNDIPWYNKILLALDIC
ncbi:35818_t:CDS:2, partial [Racocetra persica]